MSDENETGVRTPTMYFTPTGLHRETVRERHNTFVEFIQANRIERAALAVFIGPEMALELDQIVGRGGDVDMLLAEVEALSAIVEQIGRAATEEIEKRSKVIDV